MQTDSYHSHLLDPLTDDEFGFLDNAQAAAHLSQVPVAGLKDHTAQDLIAYFFNKTQLFVERFLY